MKKMESRKVDSIKICGGISYSIKIGVYVGVIIGLVVHFFPIL